MRRAGMLWAFVELVRASVLRDRMSLFFMLVLPVLIMLIIGITFGGADRLTLGLYGAERSPTAAAVERALRDADGIEIRSYDDREALADGVRGGGVAAGVVLGPGLEAAAEAGRTREVEVLAVDVGDVSLTARLAVQGVLDRVGARAVAARLTSGRGAGGYPAWLERATGVAAVAGGEGVEVREVRERREGLSRFSLTAPQNLVLFVFLNAMTAAILLVEARRTGVLARILATPAGAGTAVVGFGLGWFALALTQSLLLVGVGALLFGVSWGDPLAAAALIVVFALVGCGAGLVVGAIGRSADRVAAIAPVLGIVLAALGGCMAPLEILPDTMRAIANAVPHSWAIRAWEELIFDGGGIGDIAVELLVLAGAAAALLAAGAGVLRRELAARG